MYEASTIIDHLHLYRLDADLDAHDDRPGCSVLDRVV